MNCTGAENTRSRTLWDSLRSALCGGWRVECERVFGCVGVCVSDGGCFQSEIRTLVLHVLINRLASTTTVASCGVDLVGSDSETKQLNDNAQLSVVWLYCCTIIIEWKHTQKSVRECVRVVCVCVCLTECVLELLQMCATHAKVVNTANNNNSCITPAYVTRLSRCRSDR